MRASNTTELQDIAQKSVDSLEYFVKLFYKLRTGRTFDIPNDVPGRESHFKIIINALERVFDGKSTRLIINVPPRYGKTELIISFIAWAMAQYPDSNHMYVSYSHNLAKKQTQTIREIIQMKEYRELFDVRLKEGSQEKSQFESEQSGICYGLGAGSGITGKGAGLKGVLRYGGAIIIDDIIKPEDALSDTVRTSTNEWFYNTLQSRINSPRTPIIVIGQRTHEDDLCAHLIEAGAWEVVSLPALDEAGNALYPDMHDKFALLKLQQESPWVYAAQYQQNPVAGGTTLFNAAWFKQLATEPAILATFLTVDTSETDKTYNDASVFSFWGVYQLEVRGALVPDAYALHWIDCLEIRVEPKDLQSTFMDFYAGCMRHSVKPKFAALEKKSTGVTLSSVLKDMQGLRVVDIERTKASGSKTARYLEMQPFIANKLISLPHEGKHTQMCIKHMSKITANMAHRFDDICDTAYDAVKMALIDKVVINSVNNTVNYNAIGQEFNAFQRQRDRLKQNAFGR